MKNSPKKEAWPLWTKPEKSVAEPKDLPTVEHSVVNPVLENAKREKFKHADTCLGMPDNSKTDEFSEKFQMAFDPLPPLIFGKSYCGFRDKSAYVHYGGTVVYYMILFPMRCM